MRGQASSYGIPSSCDARQCASMPSQPFALKDVPALGTYVRRRSGDLSQGRIESFFRVVDFHDLRRFAEFLDLTFGLGRGG
jgi:hypothetical protein